MKTLRLLLTAWAFCATLPALPQEPASPGYYAASLSKYGIRAEATATAIRSSRCGTLAATSTSC